MEKIKEFIIKNKAKVLGLGIPAIAAILALVIVLCVVLSGNGGDASKTQTGSKTSVSQKDKDKEQENTEDETENLTVNDEGEIVDAETGEVVDDAELTVDDSGNIVNDEGKVVVKKEQVEENKNKNQNTSSTQGSSNNKETTSSSGDSSNKGNASSNSNGNSGSGNSGGSGSGSGNTNTGGGNSGNTNTGTGGGTSGNTGSTNQPTTPSTPPASTTPTTPSSPYDEIASASNVDLIAERVLYYINQYRSTPATKLPGLTRLAKYRSTQLTRNFAHLNDCEWIEACTAVKYGELLYTEDGEPYYTNVSGGETCDMHSMVGKTIDNLAKEIASDFKNSPAHRTILTDEEYRFFGIGCTVSSTTIYTCVNTLNKSIYG